MYIPTFLKVGTVSICTVLVSLRVELNLTSPTALRCVHTPSKVLIPPAQVLLRLESLDFSIIDHLDCPGWDDVTPTRVLIIMLMQLARKKIRRLYCKRDIVRLFRNKNPSCLQDLNSRLCYLLYYDQEWLDLLLVRSKV